jgi:hypothetical protein
MCMHVHGLKPLCWISIWVWFGHCLGIKYGYCIVEMHNGNCIVQIVKWKCKMHSGNCIPECTCNLTCNWIYVIFDMFYYNVKWSFNGKDLKWSPRRQRFKPWYQQLYFDHMLTIQQLYIGHMFGKYE